jgi:hypothetical protein
VEIEHLETNLEKLKDLRGITLAHLDRLMLYQKYLESVVEAAPAYHEINDLLLRWFFIVIFFLVINIMEKCLDQMFDLN